MRAYQLTGTNLPLALNQVPAPVAGPGEVVIDVKACGLCHSDIGFMTDPAMGAIMPLPLTLGHEIAGRIAAVGPDVAGWRIGDRVGVCPSGAAPIPGFLAPGGFADKYKGLPEDLIRIPDSISWALGAAATDAGMTSYHALMVRGGLQPGWRVGIIGFGGLGQIAARVAVLKGAEVCVAEPKQDIWPLIRAAGVASVVADAADWAGSNLDLAVDFAGFGTTGKALDAVRPGGTVVQVGIGNPELVFDATSLLANKSLLGSMGGTVQDIAAVYELMAAGEIAPEVTEIAFEQIPEGLSRLEAGQVTGRLVMVS
ncbi:MAG: zinc-binding dehydrogenase [Bifidobacteriaceae bacterium]|jgi:propanol-preferring alcohol dehydrogenase|nr:zinc-binding dehydrogenase [Bifidobacteriaceae bacterium]